MWQGDALHVSTRSVITRSLIADKMYMINNFILVFRNRASYIEYWFCPCVDHDFEYILMRARACLNTNTCWHFWNAKQKKHAQNRNYSPLLLFLHNANPLELNIYKKVRKIEWNNLPRAFGDPVAGGSGGGDDDGIGAALPSPALLTHCRCAPTNHTADQSLSFLFYLTRSIFIYTSKFIYINIFCYTFQVYVNSTFTLLLHCYIWIHIHVNVYLRILILAIRALFPHFAKIVVSNKER